MEDLQKLHETDEKNFTFNPLSKYYVFFLTLVTSVGETSKGGELCPFSYHGR